MLRRYFILYYKNSLNAMEIDFKNILDIVNFMSQKKYVMEYSRNDENIGYYGEFQDISGTVNRRYPSGV